MRRNGRSPGKTGPEDGVSTRTALTESAEETDGLHRGLVNDGGVGLVVEGRLARSGPGFVVGEDDSLHQTVAAVALDVEGGALVDDVEGVDVHLGVLADEAGVRGDVGAGEGANVLGDSQPVGHHLLAPPTTPESIVSTDLLSA
jgi:hypothetical protein